MVLKERDVRRFWMYTAIGFIIMVLAVGMSLVIGLSGMAGMLMAPALTGTWIATLIVILVSIVIASFLMGMAARKLTK